MTELLHHFTKKGIKEIERMKAKYLAEQARKNKPKSVKDAIKKAEKRMAEKAKKN